MESFIVYVTGVPRTDCGTENTNLAFLRPYFRRIHNDCFSGSSSFRYGMSVSNQPGVFYIVITFN